MQAYYLRKSNDVWTCKREIVNELASAIWWWISERQKMCWLMPLIQNDETRKGWWDEEQGKPEDGRRRSRGAVERKEGALGSLPFLLFSRHYRNNHKISSWPSQATKKFPARRTIEQRRCRLRRTKTSNRSVRSKCEAEKNAIEASRQDKNALDSSGKLTRSKKNRRKFLRQLQ